MSDKFNYWKFLGVIKVLNKKENKNQEESS